MKTWLPLIIAACICLASARAAELTVRLDFVDGKPVLQATLDADAPEGAKTLVIPVALTDLKENKNLKADNLTFAVGETRPYTATVALTNASDAKTPYRVDVSAGGRYGLAHEEQIWFAAPDAKVSAYALRRLGSYPQQRMELGVALAGFKDADDAVEIPMTWELRDGDDNPLVSRELKLPGTKTPAWHAIDITPDVAASVGPYRLEFSIEQDALAVFFSTSLRFGYANAVVPVTSMEDDGDLWVPDNEGLMREGYMSQYYSNQFRRAKIQDYPVVSFDAAEKHAGRRSMRVDYSSGRNAQIYTILPLPGNPTRARIWVKGNNSRDKLWIWYSDNINHGLQAWTRNATFGRELVCTLNFEGWQQFEMPVYGDGLSIPSRKGSTEELDGPMHVSVLVIEPPRLGRDEQPVDRTIWIDDLSVETQARMEERLDLELVVSDPHGRLLPDTAIHAAVGNGAGKDLAKVVVTLIARDAEEQTVYTTRQEIAVAAGQTVVATFPMTELAAKNPKGPVNIDISAFDPAVPGLRASQSRALKSAHEAGVFLDFEQPVTFSGYVPYTRAIEGASSIVEGGATGGHALALPVAPKVVDAEAAKDRNYIAPSNSVLLHPALPGMVDTVTLQIQGGAEPVSLQPMFLDSGDTGIWNRDYNIHWPEPILVDWQGWREVTIQAPEVPQNIGVAGRYYLYEARYPLNLAFEATLVGEQTAERQATAIRLDDIRVKSHIPAAERLQAEILWPNEYRIHAPGSEVQLVLRNYDAAPKALDYGVTLQSLQGPVVYEQRVQATLAAGALERVQILRDLKPGLYELRVSDLLAAPLVAYIQVLDATAYFGDDPRALTQDIVALRRGLGQTQEKAYLDFDNTEPVPNLYHYNFFRQVCKQVGMDGAYELMPVFGFSADWAGPDAQESIADGSYSRPFPNILQVPVRTIDWSMYVRECMREYHEDFDTWIFWENPDLQDAPQSIPPARYPEMLRLVHQWVKLYDPKATVVAGGFNYDRVLDYLEQIENPDQLTFDEIAVQMNLGELSPESAEMESFLDELSALLKLRETGRRIRTAELDWGIGEFVTPLQQAAYHVRAGLILDSRGAKAHSFSIINSGNAFEGYGIFSKDSYGNTEMIQTFKPWHIPKPAFFALTGMQRFLQDWRFQARVELPDRELTDNRAFVYKNAAGRLALVAWRVRPGERRYVWPAAWKGLTATDAFGFPLLQSDELICGTLPFVYYLPAGLALDTVLTDLRQIKAVDGTWPVALDLPLAEAGARTAAGYTSDSTGEAERGGAIPGGRSVHERFLSAVSQEQFRFSADSAGDLLLLRRWYFDGTGQTLQVSLNGGAPIAWALTAPQDAAPGIRESTLVLRGAVAGENTVSLQADRPADVAGYRVEPLQAAHVDLARWGMLAARQSVGDVARYQSAVGTPLKIGREVYEQGIGAHAVSYIEYPLAGQFSALEVTVGIDGYTEGRGTVEFRIYADGKEVASSGALNGFSKPTTLTVDELQGVQRLILSVTDGNDGTKNDLANWVDGRLILPAK